MLKMSPSITQQDPRELEFVPRSSSFRHPDFLLLALLRHKVAPRGDIRWMRVRFLAGVVDRTREGVGAAVLSALSVGGDAATEATAGPDWRPKART